MVSEVDWRVEEMKATRNSYPAPYPLGLAIKSAKSQEELKPLLQTYAQIYGDIPDVLCALYCSLPGYEFFVTR